MQLILHTQFGAHINHAWGLAPRKKFYRSFNIELQAAANDNGIVLSLTEQHAFPLKIVFEHVKSAGACRVYPTRDDERIGAAERNRFNEVESLASKRY